jgi:hypothetical protein
MLVPTGSDCPRVGEPRVNREHSDLLFVAGMEVKVHASGGEATSVVIDGNINVMVAFCAELTTRSNKDPRHISGSISFERLVRELQLIELGDGEGGTYSTLPVPICRIEIELGIQHDVFSVGSWAYTEITAVMGQPSMRQRVNSERTSKG